MLSQTSIKSTLNALLEQNVDGIIFVSPHHEVLTTIPDVNCPVPIVVVAPANKYLFHSVGVDNAYATSLIIDHLVTLGHQRMAHIAGPLDWVEANARMENWHRTIQSRNLPMIPTYIGDATARSGYELAKREVTESDATAIVAYNDQTALGAIRGIKELGYSIPQDVSIIGFGDIEDAAFYDPPLTTIRENYREIGTQSMQILIDLIEGHKSTDGTITPSLIIRESTATAHDFALYPVF